LDEKCIGIGGATTAKRAWQQGEDAANKEHSSNSTEELERSCGAGGAKQQSNRKPAPRLFAELTKPAKKGQNRGRKMDKAAEEDPLGGREVPLGEKGTLPELIDLGTNLSRVAVHCNERKHSAKQCSVRLPLPISLFDSIFY
jgi:hypothetical protein